MDIDGTAMGSQSNDDIDQNLLLQFSCMNTTDREELIRQLQKLLGPNLNSGTASFFLDMNNWNLQAAVCSYLDLAIPSRLPSMSIKSRSPTDESALIPCANFERCWTLQNTGFDYWPASCRLLCKTGENFGAPLTYVPPLGPGESTILSVQFTAPAVPGKYSGQFRLVTPQGDMFGEALWIEVIVESEGTMALVQQLAAMPVPSRQENAPFGPVPDPAGFNSEDFHRDDQMC